jgi:DNA-binding phage protein
MQADEKATERGIKMALTKDFRETVQARVRRDPAFRQGLLGDAIESLLAGDVALGKEILRDYINATVGFPKLASHTKIHTKTLHQMFGPSGNPTARNLFEIVAYLQRAEGVSFQVRSSRTSVHSKKRSISREGRRVSSVAGRR